MRLQHKTSTALVLALALGAALILGSCTVTPIATPTPGEVNAGGGPVLVWHREGGIAGFCDDLTVNADGSYTAERCTGEAMTSTLTADEQALLNDWIARLRRSRSIRQILRRLTR